MAAVCVDTVNHRNAGGNDDRDKTSLTAVSRFCHSGWDGETLSGFLSHSESGNPLQQDRRPVDGLIVHAGTGKMIHIGGFIPQRDGRPRWNGGYEASAQLGPLGIGRIVGIQAEERKRILQSVDRHGICGVELIILRAQSHRIVNPIDPSRIHCDG